MTKEKPYNIPTEAELLAFTLTNHCQLGNSFKSAVDLTADALRLAYEVGYKRGVKDGHGDFV